MQARRQLSEPCTTEEEGRGTVVIHTYQAAPPPARPLEAPVLAGLGGPNTAVLRKAFITHSTTIYFMVTLNTKV